jgi:hypothetical protein
VVEALDASATPYMLTGSLVSSMQGEPRSTHDMDFIVLLDDESASGLWSALRKIGGYIDEGAMRRAVRTRAMFNLIDSGSGTKVDFWLLTDSAFDESRFARRHTERLLNLDIWVSTPEDTILAKLQHPSLDRVYLQEWVESLDLQEEWRRLLDEAEPLYG